MAARIIYGREDYGTQITVGRVMEEEGVGEHEDGVRSFIIQSHVLSVLCFHAISSF